jgi:hypothetical protein
MFCHCPQHAGVTTLQGALAAAAEEQPDYIMPSVAALAGLPPS